MCVNLDLNPPSPCQVPELIFFFPIKQEIVHLSSLQKVQRAPADLCA